MSTTNTSTPSEGLPEPSESARVIEIFETILTALILALVFRAFFVEAFVIPTGSMSTGLLGQHLAWECENCGWAYAVGPANAGDESRFIAPVSTDCPNCHYVTDLRERALQPREGDRIIVHKWPYPGLLSVDRWDVVVFRDPVDPTQNYIKRVVGLPGETIEILDGDVYVQAPGDAMQIARKTEAAQSVLWSVVYDQDYQPRERTGIQHPRAWHGAAEDTSWSGLQTRALQYTPDAEQVAWLRFAPEGSAEYLRDVLGYNYSVARNFVGDVRVRVDAEFADGTQPGAVLLELERDAIRYVLQIDSERNVQIDIRDGDRLSRRLGPVSIHAAGSQPLQVELRHVDCEVRAYVNGRLRLKGATDLGDDHVDSVRSSVRGEPVGIRVGATGRPVTLRHLRIDRDVYYTQTPKTLRATPGQPFTLAKGEYFVLGDNSPASHDSREWFRAGRHLTREDRPQPYRLGTVPEDQIVGKAFFVYLPGLLPGADGAFWRLPDIGRMRFIR